MTTKSKRLNKQNHKANTSAFDCRREGASLLSLKGTDGIRVKVISSNDRRMISGTCLYLFDAPETNRDSLKYTKSDALLTVSLLVASKRPLRDGCELYEGDDFKVVAKKPLAPIQTGKAESSAANTVNSDDVPPWNVTETGDTEKQADAPPRRSEKQGVTARTPRLKSTKGKYK